VLSHIGGSDTDAPDSDGMDEAATAFQGLARPLRASGTSLTLPTRCHRPL
jgi:hypothetical protein